MKQKITPLILVTILFSFLSEAQADTLENKKILIDDKERSYLVYFPKGYSENKKYPLLVALHGGGGNMNHMAKTYGILKKADEEKFIAVFPSGLSKRGELFGNWNAGNCCGWSRDNNINDVKFIKELVIDLKKNHSINENKIYATGMSNGAMISYRLACEMGDTFKAIAAIAGTDNTKDCNPQKLPHIIHIHARDDENILLEGGAGKKAVEKSKITNFNSLSNTINKWLSFSDGRYVKENVLKNEEVTCDRYKTANGQNIQVCITENGGHSWPGADYFRNKKASNAINANDEMWKFFKSLD